MENTLTPPKMSAEKEPLLLKVSPAKIKEGAWVLEASQLIGYDQLFDTEGDAKAIAVLVKKVAEADRKELLSLVQVLVDKGNAVVERWDSPLWKDVPHTGTFINDLRSAVEAVAKYGITPSQSGHQAEEDEDDKPSSLYDERDAYRGHLLDLMGRVTHDFKCPLYDGHPSRANESCECGLSERLTAIKQLIEP